MKVKDVQCVYKHLLPYLRWLGGGGERPEADPFANEIAALCRCGVITDEGGARLLTDLGRKVLECADRMAELRAAGVKLSW